MKVAILLSTLIALSVSVSPTARAACHVAEVMTVAADTVKVKKERVKKETQPAIRDDADDATDTHETAGGTSFFGSCLGSLFGSMLESICGSIFSSDSDNQQAVGTPLRSTEDYALERDADVVHYEGNIEPEDLTTNSVALWDRPGGYEDDGARFGDLQRGTPVHVKKYSYYRNVLWALVESNEPDRSEGWVAADDLVISSGSTDSDLKSERQAEDPKGSREVEYGGQYATNVPRSFALAATSIDRSNRPRFACLAEFSYPVFANKSISEEYNSDAYRFGAELGFFLTETICVGPSIDFLRSKGTPLYDYVAAGLRDSPQSSEIRAWSFGLQFGQFVSFGSSGAFFRYAITPAVFGIEESARIIEYEDDLFIGQRTDELSKWKMGGEAEVATGITIAGRIPIGFSVRYSLIPWEGDQEKSLTLDYLDSNSISIFSFGFNIGYIFF